MYTTLSHTQKKPNQHGDAAGYVRPSITFSNFFSTSMREFLIHSRIVLDELSGPGWPWQLLFSCPEVTVNEAAK